LGKKQNRREYDLGLERETQESIQKRYAGNRNYADLSQMSREERAAAMGYHVDPNFSYGNDTYVIAGMCVVIIIVGFFVHFKIARISYESHTATLNAMTKKISDEYESSRVNAMALTEADKANPYAAIDAMVTKNDNENGEFKKIFEEAKARRERRKLKKLEEKAMEVAVE